MSPSCSRGSESIRPADLLLLWQQRGDFLHEYGDPNSARLWRLAAVELERAPECLEVHLSLAYGHDARASTTDRPRPRT